MTPPLPPSPSLPWSSDSAIPSPPKYFFLDILSIFGSVSHKLEQHFAPSLFVWPLSSIIPISHFFIQESKLQSQTSSITCAGNWESGPLPLLPVSQIHPFHFILIIHMLPELGLFWPGPQQQLPSWSRFLDLFSCVPVKSCWTMLVWIHSDSSRKSSIPLLVSPTPFHKHRVWLLFVPHCGQSSTQSVVFSSLLINTFCYEHFGWYCEFQIPSPYSWVHRKDTVYS